MLLNDGGILLLTVFGVWFCLVDCSDSHLAWRGVVVGGGFSFADRWLFAGFFFSSPGSARN